MRLVVDSREVYAYTGTRPFDPSSPPVVFVHGAAHDHGVWALQSRYLAHHGRSVLALDLPGHGRSAGPPLASVGAIADWLVAVLDSAQIRSAALVGHSLGSLAVLEAAARYPDRVTRIALVGPAVPMPVSEVLLAAARDDEPAARAMITTWSYSAPRQLGSNPVPGMWMTGSATALMERTPPGTLAIDLHACNVYLNGLAAAEKVRCPALVVIGQRDLMAPPKSAQALLTALGDRRAVTIPNCGHSLMMEQPDGVLDALRAFL